MASYLTLKGGSCIQNRAVHPTFQEDVNVSPPVNFVDPLSTPGAVLALRDFTRALKDYRRWWEFAALALKRSYWRTRLGMIWPALSFSLFIVSLSILWATIFGRDLAVYMPHFGYGVTCWVFINTILSGGEQVFVANAGIIREFPLPLFFYAFAKTAREYALFAMSLGVMLAIDLIYLHQLTPWALLALPGLLIYAATGVFASMLIGVAVTRYRDLAQLIPNIMRAAFFFTPVLWLPEARPQLSSIANLNPFTHYIELIRAPMLGSAPSALNFSVTGAITALLIAFTLLVFQAGTRQLRVWL